MKNYEILQNSIINGKLYRQGETVSFDAETVKLIGDGFIREVVDKKPAAAAK